MVKVKLILSLDELEKAYKEYKKPFVFWVILWYSSRNNGR